MTKRDVVGEAQAQAQAQAAGGGADIAGREGTIRYRLRASPLAEEGRESPSSRPGSSKRGSRGW